MTFGWGGHIGRTRVFVLAAALLLAAWGPVAAQRDLADVFEETKRSVATVVVFGPQGEQRGVGSGFFAELSAWGRGFVTNYHVIEYGHGAAVFLENGEVYSIDGVLWANDEYDLAIVTVDAPAHRTPPALPLAAHMPRVGERVFTIGNPLGLSHSLADGVVAALRNYGALGFPEDIQVSIPISPGNSGGPLLNMRGEVVGVMTWKFRGGEQLSFAKTLNLAARPPLTPYGGAALSEWQRLIGYPYARHLVDQGWQLQQQGHVQQALGSYELAIAENPRDVWAWFRKAYLLGETGDRQGAVDAYTVVLDIDPEHAAAYNNRAVQYEAFGRLYDAFDGFHKAVELDPEDPLYHRNLGRIYYKLGRSDLAMRAYEILLALEGGEEDAADLGRLLFAN